MRNLLDGIMLDSAQTFISYGRPCLEVEALPAEHGVPVETEPQQEDGFCVRSKMPGTSILCRVCRVFENGTFAGAVFAALEPREAMERVFFVFQERLEILLGQRGKPPRGNRLFGQSSTYTQYTWETGRVYARHTFSDRFAPTATTVVRPAPPAATTPEVSGKKRLFRGRKPGVAAWDIAIVAVVALMFPVAILKRHRQVSAGMRKHENTCQAHKWLRACCLASITDNTHRRNPCLPILAAPGAGQSAI